MCRCGILQRVGLTDQHLDRSLPDHAKQRAGELLFFARKSRRDLEDAGHDVLLDPLGFAFLGPCR